MFRKTYKEAIDDIETNKELLNSLLIKADSKGIPKKSYRPRIYTFGTVAAAAVIAIVSMHSYDNTEMIKNSGESQIVNEQKEEKTEIKNEVDSLEIVSLPKTEEVKHDTANLKKSDTAEKPPVQKAQETAPVENNPVETAPQVSPELQTEAAIMAVNDATEDYAHPAEETNEKMRAYSGGGGGGSSARAKTETTLKTEAWTMEEYSKYLGIDVEKTAVIPEDMKKTSENTVYISLDAESGEIVNDYHSFTYAGENGRYISVTTTKETEDLKNPQNQIDGEYGISSFVNGEVGFRIECYKLTEEEKNILLDSISK